MLYFMALLNKTKNPISFLVYIFAFISFPSRSFSLLHVSPFYTYTNSIATNKPYYNNYNSKRNRCMHNNDVKLFAKKKGVYKAPKQKKSEGTYNYLICLLAIFFFF